MNRQFLPFVFLCAVFSSGLAAGQSSKPAPMLAPRVDEQVELLSIVFRLAGNPEYNMDTLPAYSADIDRYFAPYRNHAAVQMASSLRNKRGVSFDAVMSMAIALSPPPQLTPLVVFSAEIPERRWGVEGAAQFLPLLRAFYRDSNFAAFYAAHQAMYRLAEQRFTTALSGLDLGWYPRFYGEKPRLAYHVLLAMNNGGGNYGPRLVQADGQMELDSIIGCWTHDDQGDPTYPPDKGYLSTIVHEFNHSFVNPAVAQRWSEFAGAEAVYSTVADRLRRSAYGNAQTMVDESLVRAAVIVYFGDHGEDEFHSLRRIRTEQRLGFVWMDSLVDLLKKYERERAQYPSFSSFMPAVASFYRDLAPHVTEAVAAFDERSAHVVEMQPFPNRAQDVDPSVGTITIVLDKALDQELGYSISYGDGGSEHYPLAGAPVYAAAERELRLPVHLKPDQTYSFVLTPAAFATTDGYPLASYTVEFKTKP